MDRTRWEITVYDAKPRFRTLALAVSEGRVVLLPPPGEGLVIPAYSIQQLRWALADANAFATRARGGKPEILPAELLAELSERP
jgi:hypothetical protein